MKTFILFLSGVIISCNVFCQANPNSLTLDIGELTGAEKSPQKAPVKNMTLGTIYLKNSFPNRSYNIAINVTPHLLPPLSVSGNPASTSAACTDLETKYNEVFKYATEEDAKKTEKELKAKLSELATATSKSGCTETPLLNKINALQSNCIREFTLPFPIEMDEDHDYDVVVTTGDRAFKYLFEGKSRGRWVMNYGFLFSSKGLEPSRYFLSQVGKDSFQVKKKGKYDALDFRFTPTIFFSYFLDKNLNKPWNNSFSLGLGFNTQSPVVSVGYNGMYNQNIGVSFGLVFYEQEKLDGRFTEGQILKENLDESKLYEKTIFRPNLFFALNIRLGENPFKTDSKSK